MNKRPASKGKKPKKNELFFDEKAEKVLKAVRELKESAILQGIAKESKDQIIKKDIEELTEELAALKKSIKGLSFSIVSGLEEIRDSLKETEREMKKSIRKTLGEELRREMKKEFVENMAAERLKIKREVEEKIERLGKKEETMEKEINEARSRLMAMESQWNKWKKKQKNDRLKMQENFERWTQEMDTKAQDCLEQAHLACRQSEKTKEMVRDLESLLIDTSQKSSKKIIWFEAAFLQSEEANKERLDKELETLNQKIREQSLNAFEEIKTNKSAYQEQFNEFERSVCSYIGELAELLTKNEEKMSKKIARLEKAFEDLSRSLESERKSTD